MLGPLRLEAQGNLLPLAASSCPSTPICRSAPCFEGSPVSTPLVFLHIPKTGGTTLREILKREFDPARTLTLASDSEAEWDRFWAMEQGERDEFDLVVGHTPFGLHEGLRPGARYVAMLRDPVERVISHYRFIRSRPNHELYEQVNALTLAQYAASQVTPELDNGQVRLLSGLGSGPTTAGTETSREHLEQALANLDQHFLHVGSSERFDDSIAALTVALGRDLRRTPDANVSDPRRSVDVTAEVRQVLEERNGLDRELHGAVNARLDAQIAEQAGHYLRVRSRLQRRDRLTSLASTVRTRVESEARRRLRRR